jgi:predicted transport protein
MPQKLLFEVELKEIVNESGSDAASSLSLLSRESLQSGSLDLMGERVFTDTRVRKVLSQLSADPPASFIKLVEQKLGTPTVPSGRLRESLKRVLDSQVGAVADSGSPRKTPLLPATAEGSSGKVSKEYPIDHHLEGKPTVILDMFEQVDEYGRSLGPDVTRRVRKQYIGYFRGKKSFFTMELQRQRIIVYLSLDPGSTHPWNEAAMRDVANIGHFGMGNVEYSLRRVESLNEVRKLIKLSYDARV